MRAVVGLTCGRTQFAPTKETETLSAPFLGTSPDGGGFHEALPLGELPQSG